MPAQSLNNIGLQFNWSLGEDGWKYGMDLNMVLTDWLLQPYISVAFKSVSAQPADPSDMTAYVAGPSPTGADWSTLSVAENDLLIFHSRFSGTSQAGLIEDGWIKVPALEGWKIYDRTSDFVYTFDGTNWIRGVDRQNFNLLADTSGDYVLDLETDTNGTVILGNLFDDANDSVTVPNDATADFPIGSTVRVRNESGGVVAIADGASVTWRDEDPTTWDGIPDDGEILLIKTAANTWAILSFDTGLKALDIGGADVTVARSHDGVTLGFDTSGAARTCTVDDETAVPLPVGFRLTVYATSGSNNLTVDFTTNSVNVDGASSNVTVSGAYSSAEFQKIGADAWVQLR